MLIRDRAHVTYTSLSRERTDVYISVTCWQETGQTHTSLTLNGTNIHQSDRLTWYIYIYQHSDKGQGKDVHHWHADKIQDKYVHHWHADRTGQTCTLDRTSMYIADMSTRKRTNTIKRQKKHVHHWHATRYRINMYITDMLTRDRTNMWRDRTNVHHRHADKTGQIFTLDRTNMYTADMLTRERTNIPSRDRTNMYITDMLTRYGRNMYIRTNIYIHHCHAERRHDKHVHFWHADRRQDKHVHHLHAEKRQDKHVHLTQQTCTPDRTNNVHL